MRDAFRYNDVVIKKLMSESSGISLCLEVQNYVNPRTISPFLGMAKRAGEIRKTRDDRIGLGVVIIREDDIVNRVSHDAGNNITGAS